MVSILLGLEPRTSRSDRVQSNRGDSVGNRGNLGNVERGCVKFNLKDTEV